MVCIHSTDNKYKWPTGRQHIHRSARSLKAEHPRSTGARLPVVLVCTLPAPRQIHDAGRPSHVIPMAIHRSVHKAKGAGRGRLPGAVVALGSSGSSASLRKMRQCIARPVYNPLYNIRPDQSCSAHRSVPRRPTVPFNSSPLWPSRWPGGGQPPAARPANA